MKLLIGGFDPSREDSEIFKLTNGSYYSDNIDIADFQINERKLNLKGNKLDVQNEEILNCSISNLLSKFIKISTSYFKLKIL